ncbi:hypothetical protein FJ930_13070 [Mesorhizobium sp. B2-4-15]|uniref:hypothetical protein n=1 Tax=Mesorhizobium sp. B2-4-15 TaxID=2589934 RepID=UPI0011511062|nr:hypothetical protein [Mesorhizobium sp. B2-4-15]TPK72097.1 hypothetical protein FJ930_13070 [Mesorhizobium sp. B2-4-15]
MRFSILLFCWAAFFGWDFATNDGEFTIGLGKQVAHLLSIGAYVKMCRRQRKLMTRLTDR